MCSDPPPMKCGPDKTNLSKFQGFGFGLGHPPTGAASGSAPKRPPAARRTGSATQASVGGVSALFRESLDEEDAKAAPGGLGALPPWSKVTAEAKQAERQAAALREEDPTIFQYDEVLDDIKGGLDREAPPQAVRTDALVQKKRVGLTVRCGSAEVKTGAKRQAKYIEKVVVATDRRKAEQQIVEDRLLKKEKNQRKDCEVFVTEAFKEELKRRKKFEDELELQDFKDGLKAAEKQEHGKGFADMYRNLLNSGLASSRGGEQLKELSAPRLDEVTGELHEDIKDEEVKMKEDVKDEDFGGSGHGVQDVAAEPDETARSKPKNGHTTEEKLERQQKTLSARERYLARKQQSQAG